MPLSCPSHYVACRDGDTRKRVCNRDASLNRQSAPGLRSDRAGDSVRHRSFGSLRRLHTSADPDRLQSSPRRWLWRRRLQPHPRSSGPPCYRGRPVARDDPTGDHAVRSEARRDLSLRGLHARATSRGRLRRRRVDFHATPRSRRRSDTADGRVGPPRRSIGRARRDERFGHVGLAAVGRCDRCSSDRALAYGPDSRPSGCAQCMARSWSRRAIPNHRGRAKSRAEASPECTCTSPPAVAVYGRLATARNIDAGITPVRQAALSEEWSLARTHTILACVRRGA
jgi:hypothetical protein